MSKIKAPCLPKDKQKILRKAQRLELISFFCSLSIVVLMFFTLGSSQAMRTSWGDDVFALIPPITFLVAVRFQSKSPNEKFPYGYNRALSIAFLGSSTALTIFGIVLLTNAIIELWHQEHPTIGMVMLFGWHFWQGWLMIAALIYSAVLPSILGSMKLPLGRELHDKVLFADADMNKANWLDAVAAVVGILGVGIGWWWADSLAAAFISMQILRDGLTNLKNSMMELIDHRPLGIEKDKKDPLKEKMEDELEHLDWISHASVRLREVGNLVTGEAYIVPKDEKDILDKLNQATDFINSMDWRVYNVVVVPVNSLQ